MTRDWPAVLLVAGLVCLWGAPSIAQVLPGVVPPAALATSPTAPIDREIQLASDAFVKDPATPRWVLPHAIPDSHAEGAVVIVLCDDQMLVADPSVTYTRRAVKVNDTTALTTVGRLPIAFVPAYQRVVLHTLRVIRDGAILDRLPTARVRFLQRETGLENNVYSGVVTASILIDDLRVGDTLEFATSTIGTNPVFGNSFGAIEGWDLALPIEARRVTISMPVERRIAWRFHGDLVKSFPTPTEMVHEGLRTLSFEQNGLPAVPNEAATPPGFLAQRSLQFSEYADWNGVATWAAGLFDEHEPPSPERVALVETLKAGKTTEARVVAALEFVQSQIRYFSVSLGTSSHRPTAPNTVLARRYGDCKDKSLLLVTLLGDMGIASTPMLARLGNRTGFDRWLPTPLVFDHVIVAVEADAKTWYLDPTRLGQHGKLARMGQVHDGAQVLAASASTRSLTRIDVPDRDALSRDERVEKLVVRKLGGAGELTIVQTQAGVGAETVRTVLGAVPKERIEAALVADMEKRYPGAKLIDGVRLDDDRVENLYSMTARFELPKPVERVGGQWQVAFRPDNFGRIFMNPPDARRKAPLTLRYPLHATYRFAVDFPDEVSLAIDPHATTVSDRYFISTSDRSFRGGHSEVTIEVKTLADRIATDDLPTWRDDVQKFQRSFPGLVVVHDADIKKSVFLGLGTKTMATTIKARQEDLVARISTTIKDGRLSGNDLARAFCERASASASLGKVDDALRDADRAVEIDPNAPDMLLCRAETWVMARNFDQAIEGASHALVLGADAGRVYRLRGRAKFHLGRYADAAEDFVKANAVDHDPRSNRYSDVWRAMAYRRMQHPLPEDLSRPTEGDWPQALLGLFADRVTPERVASLAAQKPGDEAILDETEADFYIGEYWLAMGDPVKAREAFNAVRARGVITYVEYGGAGVELDRLGTGR